MSPGRAESLEARPLHRLARALEEREATLAVAESCTGGLLAADLTARPGASAYFLGGVVAYADRVKVDALGVEPRALDRHGAVSREVAEAMAQGARERFRSSLAVSLTGIAGPGGGTSEKPVGLVFISVVGPKGSLTRRFVFPGDREAVRSASVGAAAELVLEALEADSGAGGG